MDTWVQPSLRSTENGLLLGVSHDPGLSCDFAKG